MAIAAPGAYFLGTRAAMCMCGVRAWNGADGHYGGSAADVGAVSIDYGAGRERQGTADIRNSAAPFVNLCATSLVNTESAEMRGRRARFRRGG